MNVTNATLFDLLKEKVQSSKLKEPSFFYSASIAIFFLWLLWFWHSNWASPLPQDTSGFFNIPALRFKFFESGPIPYAILWTFFFGLHYLQQIRSRILVPFSLSRTVMANVDSDRLFDMLRKTAPEHVIQFMEGQFGHIGKRVAQLYERFYGKDQDLSAVIALKNDVLEIDEENFAIAFSAITWSEVALPLLGFLGTVMGIGYAMVEIGEAFSGLLAGKEIQDVAPYIHQGLQGMAVAFDTTFLGLAGVLIIGLRSFLLKKALASQLASVRENLTDTVAGWQQKNPVASVIEETVVVELRDLETRMQDTEDAVRSGEERTIKFRENIIAKVEHVIREAPELKSVKKALFRPIVEFSSVGENLAIRTSDFITKELGHASWKIACFSSSLSSSYDGVVAVRIISRIQQQGFVLVGRDKDENDEVENSSDPLLFFTVDDEHNRKLIYAVDNERRHFDLLLPSSDDRKLLAFTSSNQLVLLTISAYDGEDKYQVETIYQDMSADDKMLPVDVENKKSALVIRREARFFDVILVDICSKGDFVTSLGQLPEDIDWSVGSTHASSATLILAGKAGEQWQLWLGSVTAASPQRKNDQPYRKNQLKKRGQIAISLMPKEIVALSKSDVLILDSEGVLHYWEPSRTVPIRLSHQYWKIDKECTIRAGQDGWIAVAANNQLTMWQVRGGRLYPYEDPQKDGQPMEFTIDNIDMSSLRATSDGRYLHALKGQIIFTWKFPRYLADE